MPSSREDVLALAGALFGTSNLNNIMAMLDEYGTQSFHREVNRVQLAILQLSQSNKDKLRYLINIAKTDYRDILAWQELGELPAVEGAKWQMRARSLIDQWGKK